MMDGVTIEECLEAIAHIEKEAWWDDDVIAIISEIKARLSREQRVEYRIKSLAFGWSPYRDRLYMDLRKGGSDGEGRGEGAGQ